MRVKSQILGVAFCAVIAASGNAIVIDTFPDSYSTTSGWWAQAQTFHAPTGNEVLLSWQFALAGRDTPGSVVFSIVPWGGMTPRGTPLYSTTVSWGTSDSTPLVSGINLTLDPGQLYAAVIDLQGYVGRSVLFSHDSYSGGAGYWSYDGLRWYYYGDLDATFRAEFGPVTVPESASVIVDALLLLPLGVSAVRRFRKN